MPPIRPCPHSPDPLGCLILSVLWRGGSQRDSGRGTPRGQPRRGPQTWLAGVSTGKGLAGVPTRTRRPDEATLACWRTCQPRRGGRTCRPRRGRRTSDPDVADGPPDPDEADGSAHPDEAGGSAHPGEAGGSAHPGVLAGEVERSARPLTGWPVRSTRTMRPQGAKSTSSSVNPVITWNQRTRSLACVTPCETTYPFVHLSIWRYVVLLRYP